MKDCWSKRKSEESNNARSNQKKDSDYEWEAEASITNKKEELALVVIIPSHINCEIK